MSADKEQAEELAVVPRPKFSSVARATHGTEMS